jgi:hypothetical protein
MNPLRIVSTEANVPMHPVRRRWPGGAAGNEYGDLVHENYRARAKSLAPSVSPNVCSSSLANARTIASGR